MTIIAFVVDNSASMYQRAYMDGSSLTFCDIARQAIEKFLVYRRKCTESAGDRYMLLTFENPPNNVKTGWVESLDTFHVELKNLQFGTSDTTKDAIKNTLDFLNRNRLQSGIDTFGHGRCPFNLEPTVIVILSNGTRSCDTDPIEDSTEGFVKQRYRWDQRIFYVGLRIPGAYVQPDSSSNHRELQIPPDDVMDQTCRLTRGRSFKITSASMLWCCIRKLIESLSPGVVLDITSYRKTEHQQVVFNGWKKCFVVVNEHNGSDGRTAGFWPIPESYRPELHCAQLPPRDAHPKVTVALKPCDKPNITKRFPFDSYMLMSSSLASRFRTKGNFGRKVWPIFIATGVKDEKPFGYLQSNSTLTSVTLFILPYNYPELLPLIGDLIYTYHCQPPPEWLEKFSRYLGTVPKYYYQYLRRALIVMKIPQELLQRILPDHHDHFLSLAVQKHLLLTQHNAKTEQIRFSCHLRNQLATRKHNVRDAAVLPSLNSVRTPKDLYLVPRHNLIDVMENLRERFFHPSPPDRSPARTNNNSPLRTPSGEREKNISRSENKTSPYDCRMRNLLKREAGPISKDFVFKRPTNESKRPTGDEELVLSDAVIVETEMPCAQEEAFRVDTILPSIENIGELHTP